MSDQNDENSWQSTDPIQVCYILGAGRSGTTFIGTLAGDLSGAVHVGELTRFWVSVRDNALCSCRAPLRDCVFWSPVIRELNERGYTDSSAQAQEQSSLDHHRGLLKILSKRRYDRQLKKYGDQQLSILRSLRARSGSRVLIDSSKYPSRLLALGNTIDINVKVLYVVRDLRGVVYSFQKPVQTPLSTWRAVVYYLLVNAFIEIFVLRRFRGRVLRVKYEDVVRSPASSRRHIARFLCLDPIDKNGERDSKEMLEVGHIVGGNRMKFKGQIRPEADNDWTRKMSRSFSFLLYLVALPLMLRNRYRLTDNDR